MSATSSSDQDIVKEVDKFKFLKEFVETSRIVSVADRPILKETANSFPRHNNDTEVLWDRIFLLDASGDLLTEVGSQLSKKKIPPTRWEKKELAAEKVSEAMLRLGEDADKVMFIVDFRETAGSLLIRRAPEGFTVKSWFEENYSIPDAIEHIDAPVIIHDKQIATEPTVIL
jgi:hypothetical protein